jgi:lysophospholipase L1-like esterase
MKLKQTLASTALVAIACLLTVLVVEGIYSVAKWNRMDESIAFSTYRIVDGLLMGSPVEDGEQSTALLTRSKLEATLPLLERMQAGLGNTPYQSLASVGSSINVSDERGCLSQKPNLQKIMVPLRTMEFELLDPPNLFVDRAALDDADLKTFVESYGGYQVSFTTNDVGERTTLPLVPAGRKVIVAGDSVANGIRLDDGDTLASQLQSADQSRQYVNLGVGGARAQDIVCRIEGALQRYAGSVDEIIYIYCENDFNADLPFGSPAEVITRLGDLARSAGVTKVTVVYAPYIYNIIPQLTRFAKYRGDGFPSHATEARALATAATEAGFRFIDARELAAGAATQAGSDFGVFALYTDVVHFSRLGVARLAEMLLAGAKPSP